MRVLLDSRDLINLVEHDQPVSVSEFIEALKSREHRIVLTMINVTEVLAPVVKTGDVERMCETYRVLDSIPHCSLRESFLIAEEIDLALKAFRVGDTRPKVLNPYVLDWRDTVTPPWSSSPKQYVCMSAEEFLREMYTKAPEFFRPHEPYLRVLQELLADNRLAPSSRRRAAARELFRGSLERHMTLHHFIPPTGDCLERFGDWLFDNPPFCPASWISFAFYQRWVDNRTDLMQEGDTHDFNLAMCLPYVDALTLDRRTTTYILQALAGTRVETLRKRLYPDLTAWFNEMRSARPPRTH